jgi:hypothetical protein
VRIITATLAALVLATSAACTSSSSASHPEIVLAGGAVEVRNVATRDLERLRRARWTREDWERLLRVTIGANQPAVLGAYATTPQAVRFTPRFPLDPGRAYAVTFDPSRLPGADGSSVVLRAIVTPPVPPRPRVASVTGVHPAAPVVPANQLRLYINFSAPMGRSGGIEHVTLLDERGTPLDDPFLPLDTDLWNDDRTRFTVLFDPGRVKRGILPHERMGRALQSGRRYTLVVSRDWKDAHGRPLAADFTHAFTAGPADERPLDTRTWKIEAPLAGTRDPLRIAFGKPLDHALLHRALGVARDGTPIDGLASVEDGDAAWRFTPRDAWRAGTHAVVVLTILEDVAGNRIGRAFEVGGTDRSREPDSITIPFEVARPPETSVKKNEERKTNNVTAPRLVDMSRQPTVIIRSSLFVFPSGTSAPPRFDRFFSGVRRVLCAPAFSAWERGGCLCALCEPPGALCCCCERFEYHSPAIDMKGHT